VETSHQEKLWKRKAVAFLVGQAITLFGSSLVQMAIIWHVTLTTSSGAWVTALTLSSLVPQILISLFSGVWADRYDRKKLIVTADAIIAVATLALALFLMVDQSGQYELWAILVVSLIRSVGSGIQSPAVSAVVPDLVPEEQLIRFNGINGSIQSLIQFTTPAAAGALMAVGPISTLLMIDVLTALIGIGILLFIQIPQRQTVGETGHNPFFADMKAGIAYAFGHKLIGGLFLIFGIFIFLSVPSGFLTTLMIQRTFGDNYLYLSINETLGFGGMVVGGLLLGAWGGFKNRIKTLAAGLLLYGVASAALGFASLFWLFAAIVFLMCLGIPIVQTSATTILQEKVPPEMLGRVFSLLGIVFNGFLLLGMLLFGPLADVVAMRWLMVGTGIPLVLIALGIPLWKGFFKIGEPETNPEGQDESSS
jgi:DHA3 family macrolide efflux protein-like MFS transporter